MLTGTRLSTQLRRFVALPHSEGCGAMGRDSQQIYDDVMLGQWHALVMANTAGHSHVTMLAVITEIIDPWREVVRHWLI